MLFNVLMGKSCFGWHRHLAPLDRVLEVQVTAGLSGFEPAIIS
jgi:hypothetical protein